MATKGVNKVILLGNLGKDPVVRYSSTGNASATLTLATSETWKDKQTGESKETTEWHRVVMFGRLAEIGGEYLRKGSKIYIEGRLRTRQWKNQQGQDQYTTEIVAAEMQMLDSRATANPLAGQPAPNQPVANGFVNAQGQSRPPPAELLPPLDVDDEPPF